MAVIPVYFQQWFVSKNKFLFFSKLRKPSIFLFEVIYLWRQHGSNKADNDGKKPLKRLMNTPNTPFEYGAPALFTGTVGSCRAQFQVCPNRTCRPLFPLSQECLVACSPPPTPSLLFKGTILQCHVGAGIGGNERGSVGLLTSVADSFLGLRWHAVIPWMDIREHMSKALNTNEDV